MRSEMTTSVVEKRRHGKPAQADYLAPSSVARPFSERRPTDTCKQLGIFEVGLQNHSRFTQSQR